MKKITKKKLAILLCLLVTVVSVTISGTLAYLSAGDTQTNTFTLGNIEVDLTETGWDTPYNNPNDPNDPRNGADKDTIDKYPGDTYVKDPTITATEGDMYFRVKVELVDTAGNLLTTQTAAQGQDLAAGIATIWSTIYYDDSSAPFAEGTSYNDAAITAKNAPHYNTANFYEVLGSTTDVRYYYYSTDATNPAVLSSTYTAPATAPLSVVLFNRVVLSEDLDSQDFLNMGDYQIKITVEAVQATNIAPTQAQQAIENAFLAQP